MATKFKDEIEIVIPPSLGLHALVGQLYFAVMAFTSARMGRQA